MPKTFHARFAVSVKSHPSSETQGQIVGARERPNGRKKKNGAKKSKERHFFSARLVFPLPPLSAPGSPRMSLTWRNLLVAHEKKPLVPRVSKSGGGGGGGGGDVCTLCTQATQRAIAL